MVYYFLFSQFNNSNNSCSGFQALIASSRQVDLPLNIYSYNYVLKGSRGYDRHRDEFMRPDLEVSKMRVALGVAKIFQPPSVEPV